MVKGIIRASYYNIANTLHGSSAETIYCLHIDIASDAGHVLINYLLKFVKKALFIGVYTIQRHTSILFAELCKYSFTYYIINILINFSFEEKTDFAYLYRGVWLQHIVL